MVQIFELKKIFGKKRGLKSIIWSNNIGMVEFVHTFREGNHFAEYLAKLGVNRAKMFYACVLDVVASICGVVF